MTTEEWHKDEAEEGKDQMTARVVEPLVLLYKLYRVVKAVEIDASFVA